MKDIEKLNNITNEFVENCNAIDDTANAIYRHSEELLKYLDMSFKLNYRCRINFESISDANSALRDQYDIIWNTSSILLKNIIEQQNILEKIKENDFIDDKSQKKAMFRISMIKESLEKVDSVLKKIISRNNEIILIDYLLVIHNEFETKYIHNFCDFKEDFSGHSSEILKVSMKLLNKIDEGKDIFNNLESIINEKNKNSLAVIGEIISNLTDFAETISNNVQTFFSKMTKVSLIIKKLFRVSESIFELLNTKENFVNENLEKVAEIAVVLSLEIKNYLRVKELVELLKNYPEDDSKELSKINMLEAYINIAVDNVEKLVELNHYMVEIFNSNVINEEKTVELVKMNRQCVKNLKIETNRMYDFILSEKELVSSTLKITNLIAKNIDKIITSIS